MPFGRGLSKKIFTHVCLESTGSYWKPVDNLLGETVVVWLINPSHVKTLRGRKTDVKDSQWLAEHSRHVNRIQKVLEGANIKLSSVITDVMGVSGRRIRSPWRRWPISACAPPRPCCAQP
jgi:transposase